MGLCARYIGGYSESIKGSLDVGGHQRLSSGDWRRENAGMQRGNKTTVLVIVCMCRKVTLLLVQSKWNAWISSSYRHECSVIIVHNSRSCLLASTYDYRRAFPSPLCWYFSYIAASNFLSNAAHFASPVGTTCVAYKPHRPVLRSTHCKSC